MFGGCEYGCSVDSSVKKNERRKNEEKLTTRADDGGRSVRSFLRSGFAVE